MITRMKGFLVFGLLLKIGLIIAENTTTTLVTNTMSPSSPSTPSTTATTAPSTKATTAPPTTTAPSTKATTAPSTKATTAPSTKATTTPSTKATTAPSTKATITPSKPPTTQTPKTASSVNQTTTQPTMKVTSTMTTVGMESCTYSEQNCTQRSCSSQCECSDGFIPTLNTTCINKGYLRPHNIQTEASETEIEVCWDRRLANVTYDIEVSSENYNRIQNATNRTSISTAQPGQKFNISFVPVLNGQAVNLTFHELTNIAAKPAIPGRVIIPPGGWVAPNITLRWNKSRGFVDWYHLYLKFPSGESIQLNTSTTSAEVTGLGHGRIYTLVIKAMSGNEASNRSTPMTVQTNALEPGRPRNVRIQHRDQRSVQLVIEAPDDFAGPVTHYQAKVFSKAYGRQVYEPEREERRLSVRGPQNISDLSPGTSYIVRIFSHNLEFRSTESTNITFITIEEVPGEAHINITTVRSDYFVVRIARPTMPNGNITGYVLVTSSAGDCQSILVSGGGVNCANARNTFRDQDYHMCVCTVDSYLTDLQSFQVRELQPYTNYTLELRAHNGAGFGTPFYKTARTAIGAPHAPVHVTVTDIRANQVKVTWKYGTFTGPTHFSLEIIDEIQHQTPTYRVQGTDPLVYLVKGLRSFWKYSVRVIATSANKYARSPNKLLFQTAESKPGPVQNLMPVTRRGSDCTQNRYGVKWTEPGLLHRHSHITQYRVEAWYQSQLYSYWKNELPVYDEPIHPNSTPYSNTTNELSVAKIEPSQSEDRTYTIKVISISTGNKRTPASVHLHILLCTPGLSAGERVAVFLLVVICIAAVVMITILLYRMNYCPFGQRPAPPVTHTASTGQPRRIKRQRLFVLRNIKQLIDRFKKDSGRLLILEWDDLQNLTQAYPSQAAGLDNNTSKNRYQNVLAYDHTRVKLCSAEHDYINANFIPGYKHQREYIACQGPLPHTVVDFWQMIWEQDVPIIVMLTKCQEEDKVKCEQYWPGDLNEPAMYGMVEVTRAAMQQENQYVYSEFIIRSAGLEKSIKHFQFLEWPDFSADLEPNMFLEFIFRIKGEIHDELDGPIIVHCSAGVGRTGTYLAIDYLIDFLKEHNLSQEFDIFQFVLSLRKNRSNMVQAKSQYMFIHECLWELVRRQMLEDDLSDDGLHIPMPSEEEYSEQLFGASNGSIQKCHPDDVQLMDVTDEHDDDAEGQGKSCLTTEL